MNETFNVKRLESYYKGKHFEGEEDYITKVFADTSNVEELEELMFKQFNDESSEDGETERMEKILYRLHYDINMQGSGSQIKTINRIAKWTIRIAAAILLPLVVLSGIKFYNISQTNKRTYIEIKAPAWTRAEFLLPDGTQGWLNSSSSIKYKGDFATKRNVQLIGEAFFDVQKDRKKPFTVSAGEISVKVLGTRFNVASYDDEKTIEVVLEQGEVQFICEDMDKSYTMKPSDMVVYNKVNKDFTTEVVQPRKFVSWKEGKLIFRNDPIDIISRRLARWYNVDVVLEDGISDDIRWRATFTDENLEEVLNFMKRSLPVDYKIENKDIQTDDASKKKVIITPRTK